MEAILGGPLGLSTAPAAPDFAVTPGGRAVSANGIVQPDAFGPIAAGMRSDMPPLLADQVYDVEYSVVPGAPKALSEAPRGLPLGQDKSPVAPESPQPVAVQTDGESTPLQLTRINDKSFMLHGDTGPFEEAIKAAGGRLDRKVGGWRFPLAREGEIRESTARNARGWNWRASFGVCTRRRGGESGRTGCGCKRIRTIPWGFGK